jgi:uncharacterized protein (TIGR00266 family)
MGDGWWMAIDGHQVGPLGAEEVRSQLAGGSVTPRTLVWRSGMPGWKPLDEVPELGGAPPAQVDLDPGESAVAEAGAMMFVQPEIEMDTVFGDGSGQKRGLFDALVGAGKRLLTGESLFMTVFTNKGSRARTVAFASPYPGKILAMDLRALGGELLCQKDAFLCAAQGVSIGIAFQKRFGAGLFGGEGFILQRLEGDGLSFVHAGGTLHALELAAGESLRVDTGCVVALAPTIAYDIEYVGKLRTAFFGGEGLFFARLTGPGRVWLQSLPFSRLADRVWRAAPQTGGRRVGEGSILDKAFGLGNLLDGDG